MSSPCRTIQTKLAEEGRGFLREDATMRGHVESCEVCASFLERLAEVDHAIAALPAHDAPDSLVERLLARPELSEPVPETVDDKRSFSWRWGLGSVAAAVLVFWFGTHFWISSYAPPPASDPDVRFFEVPSEQDELVDGIEGGVPDGVVGGVVGGIGEGVGVGGGFGGRAATPPPEPPPPPPPASAPVQAPRFAPAAEEESGLTRPRRSLLLQEANKEDAGAEERKNAFADGRLNANELRLGDRLQDKKREDALNYDLPASSDLDVLEKRFYRDGRDRQAGLGSLAFLTPSGYWSNTYVPGDAMLRFLDARLRELGRPANAAALHDAVRRVEQPFDAPERNALAVYLSAERRAVTEPTRITLQVGLRAMERQASRRPAMNVAVVLDRVGVVPLEVDHAMSALSRAFADATDLGDSLRYVVAGTAPEEIDLSPVIAETLPDALARGIELVAASEDQDTVLGASLVILVTGQSQGAALERLEALAHRSAVGGIPVSVMALGTSANASEVERMALAGQGSRRLVAQPSDAASVVDAELSSASRVVARAIRLRIRLAPGVGLVSVLGSEKLDEANAERVREAEQAIDQRLARNLGIAADRGEDEEGIQIVIPSFYTGDSHVVLLDVVAPGPGAVADVTARFKDVGSLSNEVARASLTLERGESVGTGTETALETNVVKNVLAFRLSEALEGAGEALARGEVAGAIAVLEEFRRSLITTMVERPQLDDPDVRADIALLDLYLALLGTSATGDPALREYVSASLRFASRLKVTSRLALD